ncbi:MAG: helical backbone metal receptor [Candidatus Binatia bacterium]|nr:helical backbone metal receptor [Candidatus Binatia bacterium]
MAAEPPAGGARRVVSLAPSVTETIFALGAEDRLVAVSSYCDFPPAARALPRVGSYLQPNVEAILGVEPDVVIGVPTPGNRAAVDHLRRLGVEVVVVSEDTVPDAFASMRTVGRWLGKPEQAEALVADVQGQLAAVRGAAAAEPRRRVLFVVGHDPLVVAGGALFLNELIEVAGGENVGAIGGGTWPRLSLETVVAAAPEVIIDGAMGTEAGPGGDAGLLRWWEPYRSVPAVRDRRVRAQRSNALLRPGPRLGVAARELFELVHGKSVPTPTPTPDAP